MYVVHVMNVIFNNNSMPPLERRESGDKPVSVAFENMYTTCTTFIPWNRNE